MCGCGGVRGGVYVRLREWHVCWCVDVGVGVGVGVGRQLFSKWYEMVQVSVL